MPSWSPSICVSGQFLWKYLASSQEVTSEQCLRPSQRKELAGGAGRVVCVVCVGRFAHQGLRYDGCPAESGVDQGGGHHDQEDADNPRQLACADAPLGLMDSWRRLSADG